VRPQPRAEVYRDRPFTCRASSPWQSVPAEAAEEAPTSLAQFYPLGDILAVIDNRADAARAVIALKEAGVPETDIDLVDGAWFIASMRELKERRTPFEKFLAVLVADEGEATQPLVQQAGQGHTIVVVHAEQPHICAQVVKVLAQHRAHTIQHYGKLVMTVL
jgi:hypothetical protein